MLGLTLREEFRGKRLKGTAIELSNDTNTGATQIAAKEFLEITYPTHDLLKGSETSPCTRSLPTPPNFRAKPTSSRRRWASAVVASSRTRH
jgi:hypothetical protein